MSLTLPPIDPHHMEHMVCSICPDFGKISEAGKFVFLSKIFQFGIAIVSRGHSYTSCREFARICQIYNVRFLP